MKLGHALAPQTKDTCSDAISISGRSTCGDTGEVQLSFIAIVEDDESVRESLEGLLMSAGYATILYSSAEHLLGSGRLGDIVCLISDIGLPGMNGIELLRAIRSRRPELPVIIITGRHEPNVLQAALDAGARHVFRKPLGGIDLLEAVAAAH